MHDIKILYNKEMTSKCDEALEYYILQTLHWHHDVDTIDVKWTQVKGAIKPTGGETIRCEPRHKRDERFDEKVQQAFVEKSTTKNLIRDMEHTKNRWVWKTTQCQTKYMERTDVAQKPVLTPTPKTPKNNKVPDVDGINTCEATKDKKCNTMATKPSDLMNTFCYN